MSVIRVTLAGEVDEMLAPDLPFVKRAEYPNIAAGRSVLASSVSFVTLKLMDPLTTIQALVLMPEATMAVKLGGSSVALTINAGGCFVLFPTSLDNSGGTAVTIQNNSGNSAGVRVLAGGQ